MQEFILANGEKHILPFLNREDKEKISQGKQPKLVNRIKSARRGTAWFARMPFSSRYSTALRMLLLR